MKSTIWRGSCTAYVSLLIQVGGLCKYEHIYTTMKCRQDGFRVQKYIPIHTYISITKHWLYTCWMVTCLATSATPPRHWHTKNSKTTPYGLFVLPLFPWDQHLTPLRYKGRATALKQLRYKTRQCPAVVSVLSWRSLALMTTPYLCQCVPAVRDDLSHIYRVVWTHNWLNGLSDNLIIPREHYIIILYLFITSHWGKTCDSRNAYVSRPTVLTL